MKLPRKTVIERFRQVVEDKKLCFTNDYDIVCEYWKDFIQFLYDGNNIDKEDLDRLYTHYS